MCDTCGCGQSESTLTYLDSEGQQHNIEHSHEHEHNHTHDHDHHDHHHGREIIVEEDLLTRNNLLAERNRGYFEGKNVLALNLVSSPGSGKTTLLERTLTELKEERPFAVIEGDQQTLNDAQRIQATGSPVVQINTGQGCHLDAHMIHHAIQKLELEAGTVLMIENVGNLVCPALFDLGEAAKVVIISTTEGDDKPIKYPTMFQAASLCLINKMDLLPYVDFDVEKMKEYACKVNPKLTFFEVSAKTGQGLEKWYDWLRNQKQ